MTDNERIAVLETQMADTRADMSEIKDDVKHIRSAVDHATGGWKMLLLVGGFAGTVGAVIVKLVDWVKTH